MRDMSRPPSPPSILDLRSDAAALPARTVAALREAGATVALAESCTSGLVAALLGSVPGVSEVLVFSAVVYQEAAKTMLLGLEPAFVAREGAVSVAVTRQLAEAARAKAGATLGAAVTGWAGPTGGTARDPVGTVYLCLTDGERTAETRQVFPGPREAIRQAAALALLELIRMHARGVAP